MKRPGDHWLYLTTSEALEVAQQRGVSEEQAKADIVRGLKQGARKIDGKVVGFVIVPAAPLLDGSFRQSPMVDFERSEMLARPKGRATWQELRPQSSMIEFWITRESVDWLWPGPEPAGAVRETNTPKHPGRPALYRDDEAMAVHVVSMIKEGQAPNVRQAVLSLAGNLSGNDLTNFEKRMRRQIGKLNPDLLKELGHNSGT